ncbi:hypothetical protein PHLGIDRAFT_304505 [Phlebiopsis gigantea 11061_1 CR5-6]|uniref:Uncharacterized protein n=1 Tax=Phlebiopsis gigantea (strain 11061_1 CR5-6) TaxID=745531 RepID=A0A0C3NCL2_PHLG1|nr:hypothetical protein PHLGIDRAFT_304505 [Phlebiopsis gigantea 11061_1 CR5-6]
MAGYSDGLTSASVTDRLKCVRRQRAIWRRPVLRQAKFIPVPSQAWFEAKSHKDVISGRVPGDPHRLDVVYLSTSVDDKDRLKELHFDVWFDAVYIDPGQDLIVLVSLALALDSAGLRPSPRLHLRSLRDQRPHSRAKETFIDLASYGFPAVAYVRRVKIQVSGEYLAVTINKSLAVEAILVWHWPSGSILAALRSTHEATYLTAYCTSDGHLLVNRLYRYARTSFGINVYALHMDEEVPSLLAIFDLPALVWDSSQLLISNFLPGYGKFTQLNGGIAAGATHIVPAQVLVQLRVDLQYTLFTPLSAFLSPAVLEDQRRPTPLRFAWNAWGPRSCRIFDEAIEVMVCGYKAIYPNYILDFCPIPDGVEDGSITRTPTTIRSTIFAEPVETSLPFRKVRLPFPSSLAEDQLQLVFEDLDGPKIVRATCDEFILIPTSVDVYAMLPGDVETETRE